MAKIGLKYPVAAKGTYPEGAAPTYAEGFVIGKAIAADKEIKFTGNPLYANDSIAEDENTFESGTIKLGVDDIAETAQATLFGHTLTDGAETGDPKILKRGAGDQPLFVGIGYYKTGVKNSVKYYETTWIFKAKFAPPKEAAKTAEGKVSWQTPEAEGTIYPIPGYEKDLYEEVIRHTTETKAIAYLNTKAGITAGV